MGKGPIDVASISFSLSLFLSFSFCLLSLSFLSGCFFFSSSCCPPGIRSRGRRNSARSRSREKLKEEDREYLALEVAVADLMLTSDGSALKRSLFPAFQASKDLKELEGILNITPSWMKSSEASREQEA